jgi:hypothetical protein
MHWIVLLTPMPHKPIAIVAILTIHHNLQYHRLIWFHNKKYNRMTGSRIPTAASAAAAPGGVARLLRRARGRSTQLRCGIIISRHCVAYYIGFGILFGIIYQGPRQLLVTLVSRMPQPVSSISPS